MPKQFKIKGTIDDPTISFADLVVDGKTYKLCYNFAAIRKAEILSGTNLLNGLRNLNDLSADQLFGLLFGAMLVAHPKLTEDDVMDLIRLDTLPTIQESLSQAYIKSLPEKKVKAAVEDPGTVSQ